METIEMVGIAFPQKNPGSQIPSFSHQGCTLSKQSLKIKIMWQNLWKDLNLPQVGCMNLISDTGDLMGLGWAFGDIQVRKGANKSSFTMTRNSTFHCWMEITMILQNNFGGNSCCVWLFFSRSIFEIQFFQELFLILKEWLLFFLHCYQTTFLNCVGSFVICRRNVKSSFE